MMTATTWGRRGFLIRASAFLAASAAARARAASALPSNTVTMGFIGVGGRATQLLPVFMNQSDVRVLAVCDAIRERRERAKATVDAFNGDRKSVV